VVLRKGNACTTLKSLWRAWYFQGLYKPDQDRPVFKDRVKLNPGEELKLDSSRSKGFMGEEDIDEYSIVGPDWNIAGKVKYTNHMAVKGFKATKTVRQVDNAGNVIVDVLW
jgi:hypothetical protein